MCSQIPKEIGAFSYSGFSFNHIRSSLLRLLLETSCSNRADRSQFENDDNRDGYSDQSEDEGIRHASLHLFIASKE